MSHKKFGPDRFSRFDVYWIQTSQQTDKQTDKPNLYIEGTEQGWNRSQQRREQNKDVTVLHLKHKDQNGKGWTVFLLRTPRTEWN